MVQAACRRCAETGKRLGCDEAISWQPHVQKSGEDRGPCLTPCLGLPGNFRQVKGEKQTDRARSGRLRLHILYPPKVS